MNAAGIQIPDGAGGVDSARITVGNDSDLKIFHNGSHSIIRDAGTGSLLVQSNNFTVQNATGTENQITALSGGAVSLYHNDSAKLATDAYGVDITGRLSADSASIGNDIRVAGSVFIAGSGGIGATLGNTAITGVNYIQFNDAGVNEGISWNGGNTQLFESPNNLSNATGNLLSLIHI